MVPNNNNLSEGLTFDNSLFSDWMEMTTLPTLVTLDGLFKVVIDGPREGKTEVLTEGTGEGEMLRVSGLRVRLVGDKDGL